MRNCENCKEEKLGPDQTLAKFLTTDEGLEQPDPDRFWKEVKTATLRQESPPALCGGRDPCRTAAHRGVLNEQMSPAEVLAVEIKQHVDKGGQLKTLVSRVIGQTQEANAENIARHRMTHSGTGNSSELACKP